MKEYKYILLDLDGTITDPMIGITPLPIRMEFTSPRNTVPNQILQPSPISTSPIIVALSAKNVSLPIWGVKPLTDFIKAITF